tara:strand:+ start:1353 stop:2300 length:948 start_codon:yes stop_codon:yes gene_type:complete
MTNTETFFEALKAHRESQKIEIQSICEFTKINFKYIDAIESGDFSILPTVYIRLFIRSYSEFIGADSKKALKDFEKYTTGKILNETSNKIIDSGETSNKNKINQAINLGINLESDFQITPKRIASILIPLIALFFIFNLVSKITQEQKKEVDKTQIFKENNGINLEKTSDTSSTIKEVSLTNPETNKQRALSRSPLNKNNFLPQNLTKEITTIINLSPPYNFTIRSLDETKISISRSTDNNLDQLLNQIVPKSKSYKFNFDSDIYFDLLNNNHVSIKINDFDLENYLMNIDKSSIRGSYKAEINQLYLSFYTIQN